MMRINIITGVIGVAFVVLGAPSASAEKLTLACTFESGTPTTGREQDVNQVIFDTDRPRVDLRVAQTMGPVDYTFENDAERKDSIQMVSEGAKISVAAIRYGHAVVISFDRITGLLNWAFADGSRSFRYKCRR
jgi:hypothetical protein